MRPSLTLRSPRLHARAGARRGATVLVALLVAGSGLPSAQAFRPFAALPATAPPGPAPPAPFGLAGGAAAPRPNPHGPIALACEACHTADGWRPLRADPDFEHARDTGYDLVARHAQADCAGCHLGLQFTGLEGLGADCGTCHLDVHRGALGDACQTCHAPDDWGLVDGVEVHAQTAFPLTGAHLQVSCETCHAAGAEAAAFAPLPADCLACHADDLAATEAGLVPHVASGFPTDCQACHHTVAWSAGAFDHASASGGFALVGAHAPLDCASCHAVPGFEPRFAAAGQDDCLSCHADDAAAARIDHSGFPTTCTECHAPSAWAGATSDHVTLSGGFALVGAHLALDCAACHAPDLTPLFAPASQDDCLACHADDADAAQPDHGAFPETCATCHTTSAWAGATVDHAALSGGFELVGAHAVADCASCHSEPGGGLPWTPASQADCVACHQTDYASTAGGPVDHVATGFPTTCTECHTTSAWAGATFEHAAASGGFELVGAHVAAACASCHSGAGGEVPWAPASQADCVACHADDASAAQPDHTGFPTTCAECHGADQWAGATVDHPAFPIFSGRHAGEWDTCQTCHVQPSDFRVFSCVTCHEHNRADMDEEHDEVGGYVYESTACYSCHPDGEDATLR